MREAMTCNLRDKSTYDCHGAVGRYCFDCNNVVIFDLEDLIGDVSCRVCEDRECVQLRENEVKEIVYDDRIRTYEGKIDNCSYRRYKLDK